MKSELEVLAWWRERGIPARSVDQGSSPYVFFEGPPTANGKPGIHHVAARSFKDLYPRYQTMRGHRVLRRAGWDTHGLPVEVEIEKRIGSKGKQDIEKFGIAEFNKMCRDSVFSYIGDWNKLTERIGFWLDLEHPYITYENNYIETCWWILQDLFDRGFLYESYRTSMHCPRCNTSLASHEVSLGMRDEVSDPSVWPKFRLLDSGEQGPVSLLAWTTTPWTLPANVALCVKPGASYALVEGPARHAHPDGPRERYILAEALAGAAFAEGTFTVVKTMAAEELVGLRYEPLFEGYVPPETTLDNAWRVIADDFVSLEDGTGIVHIAPAYGDLEYGQRYHLPTVFSVDLAGMMYPQVRLLAPIDEPAEVAGLFFKDADPVITRALTRTGSMFRSGRVTHAYPFCWRDDTPLLFYAKNSWYIRTTLIKDKLLANNAKINWVPETIGAGRFGKWLENNIDWSLSRERYWGCPLPIWQSDDGDKVCIGSVEELGKLAGRDLGTLDLHRPYVDDITFERDGKTFRRVPYTIDVWFESGAMPYAQWHYPFENQKEFLDNFPADFICEAVDQTRGWFYTLHAIAALLTDTGGEGRRPGPLAEHFPDSPAFRNCVVLGLLTDREGKKMSKSRGNVVDPWTILDNQGADALRWYLYSSGPPDQTKAFDVEKVTETLRTFVMTLANTRGFFELYANIDQPDLSQPVPLASRPEIDRWLIADLQRLIGVATEALDRYDAMTASRAIQTFVADHLSNWYVRNNRRRFWKSGDDRDKLAAYHTLYEALVTVSKLIAPMAPFIAEEIYRGLVVSRDPSATESVHLTEWPVADAAKLDAPLLEAMDLVLRIVELGRAARSQSQIRTRQPLPELIVRVGSDEQRDALRRLQSLVLRELNVKTLTLLDVNTRFITYAIRPNLPVVGKLLGKDMRKLQPALDAVDPYVIVDNVQHGLPTEIRIDDRTISLDPTAFLISVKSPEGYSAVEDGGLLAALRTELTDELLAEGRVRELVRHIQEARRKKGLEITDRIHLHIDAAPELQTAITTHHDYIADETLALTIDKTFPATADSEITIDGHQARFTLDRA
ncbi:MAG TPA: isoleucine--tRNA ligase [Thermoanaerobaculia bacterium]|jgi:isoleucyl-tRNA synthetase